MQTENYAQLAEDYARVETVIRFLEQNFRRQPNLREMADYVGLSEYHFQRLFSRWAGISPKRFVQFLTVEYAKGLLTETPDSLLDVTYASGLSSPGRLHDLFLTWEAMTPGEFKKRGQGVEISYGFHASPFGECLLAVTGRGICDMSFVMAGERDAAVSALQSRWPQALFQENPADTRPFIESIFAPLEGRTQARPLPLFLKGTPFQIKVWQALLNVPPGTAISYEGLAAAVGQPGAARAVALAVAHNPVGFIIPCHRVIRKIGQSGDYQWGAARKKAILGREAARLELFGHPA